jgi:hypothetical protein
LLFFLFFIAHFLLVENTYKNPYSLKAVNTQSITDQLIGLELSLPQGERMTPAKVIGLSMDEEGKVIGNL